MMTRLDDAGSNLAAKQERKTTDSTGDKHTRQLTSRRRPSGLASHGGIPAAARLPV
jgi:hypothetical protein